MVKSELIQALKDKLPELQARDIELAVNCILGQMADALAQGQRIEVRGFGTKATVHFKVGKDMRDRVNADSEHGTIDTAVDTNPKFLFDSPI